jgi:hypothetical protein
LLAAKELALRVGGLLREARPLRVGVAEDELTVSRLDGELLTALTVEVEKVVQAGLSTQLNVRELVKPAEPDAHARE